MTYPQTTGYAKGSDTSRAAAETLYDREGLQFAVMSCLYNNPQGLVVDDVKKYVQHIKQRDFDRSTIAARFTELEAAGMLKATDERGTSARGKSATIYKLTASGYLRSLGTF